MNHNKLKGVNLGGWLVLEKWIAPSLFAGSEAADEYELSQDTAFHERIRQHRAEFVTEHDIAWLAERGINALRVPVGHWILDDAAPYVPGSLGYLDWVMDTAHTHRMKVVIDLHTHQGLPNDWNKAETQGVVRWPKNRADRERSLTVVEGLAGRYAGHAALWGIGLLNESLRDVPKEVLAEYYRAGYEAVRRHCSEQVAVVYHDNWRPLEYCSLFEGSGCRNMVMDMHLYQLFAPADRILSLPDHLIKAQVEQRNTIALAQRSVPVIIGEWTGRLAGRALEGLGKEEATAAQATFAEAQRAAYALARGQFYWTYKTEAGGAWSFRTMAEEGLRGR